MPSVRISEWSSLGPRDAPLEGLRLDESARRLARALSDERILEVLELFEGLRIGAYSHVGRLEVGDLAVTIDPKLGVEDLLSLVRYAYGLRDLRLFDEARFSTGAAVVHDLLAAQLQAEVRELMKRGLHRRYQLRKEWLTSPRGRIDMNALAMRTAGTTALPCRHHPRSRNHPLHGVVLSGLELAAHLCSLPALRRGLRSLATQLGHDVDPVALSVASLRRAWRSMNRLVAAYEPTLRLIGLLYGGQTAGLDDAPDLPLPGFLFDMNRFFQAVVGRLLRDHLHGCRVVEERSLREMLRYVPGCNPRGRRPPRPRPDFAIHRVGETLLLDAKYRDLWEAPLPPSMLYQLALYALSRPGRATAAIIYPATTAEADEATIEIADPSGAGALGYVALRPLVLPDLARAVRGGDAEALTAIATRAAFGASDFGRAPTAMSSWHTMESRRLEGSPRRA